MISRKIFLCLLFSGACVMVLAGGAQATKPSIPLKVSFEMDGTPQVGQEVTVRLKIQAWLDTPHVQIRCKLPTGVEMISGSPQWEGSLKSGETHEMQFVIKVKNPGFYPISASATIQWPGGGKMVRHGALVFDFGDDGKLKAKKKGKRLRIEQGKDGRIKGTFPRK